MEDSFEEYNVTDLQLQYQLKVRQIYSIYEKPKKYIDSFLNWVVLECGKYLDSVFLVVVFKQNLNQLDSMTLNLPIRFSTMHSYSLGRF